MILQEGKGLMSLHGIRYRLALIGAACAAACAPPSFVRLRSTLTVNARAGEAAEVVASRELDRLRGGVARVAVSAPDECIDFTSVGEAGTGADEASVLHQRCAVELATLERSLTAAGFGVISWRQLRDATAAARAQGGAAASSTIQVARALGAQLILDVNALDWITRARSAVDARWDRALFASDASGSVGEPLTAERFVPESLSTIEGYANAAEEELLLRTRRGAGLNVTVISTEVGQALLFYRRFLVEPYHSQAVVNVLLQRAGGVYVAVPPASLVAQPTLRGYRPSVAVTRVSRPDVVADATHNRLLQELVTDCVAQITARFGPPAAFVPAPPAAPLRAETRREEPPPPPPPAYSGVAAQPTPLPAPIPNERPERRRRHRD